MERGPKDLPSPNLPPAGTLSAQPTYSLTFAIWFSGIVAMVTFPYDKHFGLIYIYQRWLRSKLFLCTSRKEYRGVKV
jgi:hypothetical protein